VSGLGGKQVLSQDFQPQKAPNQICYNAATNMAEVLAASHSIYTRPLCGSDYSKFG